MIDRKWAWQGLVLTILLLGWLADFHRRESHLTQGDD